MTTVVDSPAVQGFLASVRDGIDGLLSCDLTSLSGSDVAGLITELETQLRRAVAVDHRLIAELSERSVAGELGASTVAGLLVQLLRVSPGVAKARVRAADELGPRRAVTGEALEPVLPVVAAAVRAGEVSAEHVAVISRVLDRVPGDLPVQVHDVAETFMVEAARHEHPVALARTGEQLLLRVDPDGREPSEAEQQRRRGFSLVKRADGSSKPVGEFTPEATALWETILDSLAAPAPSQDDGLPDDRSPDQRRHDGMVDAAYRLLDSGALPTAGGVPVTVLLRVNAEDLATDNAPVRTGHGDLWTVRQALRVAAEAAVVPLLMGEGGKLLDCGRTQRLATKTQRLALAARDQGCSFPGCDRPAAWTEAHHIVEWAAGGPTDISNLCLLCRYHHRHFDEHGWTVRTGPDGKPEWLPPPWIDPERKPIRNTAHHITDHDFRRARDPVPV